MIDYYRNPGNILLACWLFLLPLELLLIAVSSLDQHNCTGLSTFTTFHHESHNFEAFLMTSWQDSWILQLHTISLSGDARDSVNSFLATFLDEGACIFNVSSPLYGADLTAAVEGGSGVVHIKHDQGLMNINSHIARLFSKLRGLKKYTSCRQRSVIGHTKSSLYLDGRLQHDV